MDAERRHALVIAYEFPPAAGPAVQRTTALSKYLSRDGWRIDVLTAEVEDGHPQDPTMTRDVAGVQVTRLPSRRLSVAVAAALAPFKRSKSPRPDDRATEGDQSSSGDQVRAHTPMSIRIARWFAVPDDAASWGRAVVDEACSMHAQDPYDVVFATAPPYSSVVAARDIARRIGLPFVADMRDPWRDNSGVVWPTAVHRRRYERIQRDCMSAAHAVIAVSEPIAREAREMGARATVVVPNGFDPERIPSWRAAAQGPLRVVFLGRFGTGITDPAPFFSGLARTLARGGSAGAVTLTVVGPRFDWVDDMVASYGVADAVEFLGYRPHEEALDIVAGCDLGLIVLAEGPESRAVFSSKLFEYLAVGIPILLVGGDDSEAARLIEEAKAGHIVSPSSPEKIADVLEEASRAKASGEIPAPPEAAVVARFDRRRQAEVVASVLVDAIGSTRR